MLQSLRVKNLAIVEDLRIELGDGLNVITGETGAGKSIIAGALGLVLGERADRTMIRAGEEQCGVEATFQLADASAVDALLEDVGLEPCESGQLIVRRIISASGGGRNLVNDCPTTAQVLKRVGDLLVDMHGPHDHQSLFSERFQLDLLDSFGHLWKARAVYEGTHRDTQALKAQLHELDGDDQAVTQQIDLLSFQVKEIEEAELQDADEEALQAEHTTTANAQRILELIDGARQALSENDSSAFNGIASAQTALNELSRIYANATEWHEEARSIAIQIQELSNTLSGDEQDIEGDPGRLQWLEDRMALIRKLKRKYGASVPEMLTFLETTRERLHDLETRGERIEKIQAELGEAAKRRDACGKELSKQRAKAGKKLATVVTEELRDLGFSHGSFDVELTSAEPGAAGMDKIEFGFAPNVGEPMRPLRAIASSGEISRVMLATKAVLAAHDRIPVLVFDEIDANVGGEMGNAIGQKLMTVAATHQVLCITHLPQVAIHGSLHLVVTKSVEEARTRTHVTIVDGDDRAEEIARMLGGKDLTSVALRHAREMLAGRKSLNP